MEIDQAEERVQQEEEALGEMMEPAWNTEVSYAEDSDNIEPDITLNDVHPTIAEYLETPSSEKDPRILAQQKRLEDANQKLTETLLVWYDLWLETH